jgi:hypothetical protein
MLSRFSLKMSRWAFTAPASMIAKQGERRNVAEKLLYLQAKHLTEFPAPRVQSAAGRFALVMIYLGR